MTFLPLQAGPSAEAEARRLRRRVLKDADLHLSFGLQHRAVSG